MHQDVCILLCLCRNSTEPADGSERGTLCDVQDLAVECEDVDRDNIKSEIFVMFSVMRKNEVDRALDPECTDRK